MAGFWARLFGKGGARNSSRPCPEPETVRIDWQAMRTWLAEDSPPERIDHQDIIDSSEWVDWRPSAYLRDAA